MEDFGLNDQDELAGIALDIMRSFRSLELDQGMDGQSISMLAVVVEKLFLQASNMANELDENRDRISELCQQVEDFVEGNGKLRDELRCLKDSHEITKFSLDNDHGREMEVQILHIEELKAANKQLRDRNQQLISEILDLENCTQRHEMLIPRYESQVYNLQKELEVLQKALKKSDRLLEEVKTSSLNSPLLSPFKAVNHVSVQANLFSCGSRSQDYGEKLEKAESLAWSTEAKHKETFSSKEDRSVPNRESVSEEEIEVSLAEELEQADDNWRMDSMEEPLFVQQTFSMEDFATSSSAESRPVYQDNPSFFELQGWFAKLKWIVRVFVCIIFYSVMVFFLRCVKRTLVFFTRTRRSFCVLRRSASPGMTCKGIVRRRMGFSRSPEPTQNYYESQTV